MSPTKKTNMVRKYKKEQREAKQAVKLRRKAAKLKKAGFITL